MGKIHNFVDQHIYPLDPNNDYRLVFESLAGFGIAATGYGELQSGHDKAWIGTIVVGAIMIGDAWRNHFVNGYPNPQNSEYSEHTN
jgi:hypothetical protein